MTSREPYARIAVTLPPEDLAAADRLATQQDRSRSWIVAEAVRQYVVSQDRGSSRLDPSRRAQLRRDMALTAEERVLEAEATMRVDAGTEEPMRFASYDDFVAWRQAKGGAS